MKAALYARVSTQNQELKPQTKKLEKYAEQKQKIKNYDLYKEKVSSIKERPKFEKILDNLEQYDILIVTKLDRFARSTKDLLQRLEQLEQKNVEFQATDQPINTDDELYGEIMLKLLGVFAEWERKMIRRRLKEGYEKARKEGRVGRPEALNEEEKEELAALYETGRYKWSGLADKYNVSKATISKVLKEKNALKN